MCVSQRQFVKCPVCGLVYIVNFQDGMTSYATDDYFTNKHQYTSRWDDFCLIFGAMVDEIVRFKPTGRLLDVGAGVGAFLHVARQRGFEVQGVEVSEWASAFAREEKNLPVITGTLEDAKLRSRDFDVIVVNHVIEHVQDPRSLLEEISRLLKDDGILVLGVPNIGSLMARLMGAKWSSLRPDEHIWHFTPRTLTLLAERSGFVPLSVKAKYNYSAVGWSPKAVIRKLINGLAVLTNRSEAMILFATKKRLN